jgi:hypothetical protein
VNARKGLFREEKQDAIQSIVRIDQSKIS